VVVVVLVVVVVVGGGGQGSQTLPPPITTTPPSAVQVVASCSMRDVDVVQSAAVSQASEASLLHTPALVPSPGIGSLQVPRAYVQQRTVSLPHVERAAQRPSVRRLSAVKQPDLRSRLRKWTTHRTYCPWFLHGVTD